MARFVGNELRALLLDLDDTILDNRTGLREAWDLVAETVAARHPDLEAATVRKQIARSTAWFWSDAGRRRRGRLDLPRSRRAIVGHVLEALGRSEPCLAAEAARLYTRHRECKLGLVVGALETLQRLRWLVPRLGLVTNGAASTQRAKIERFDLERHFDVIVIEEEFGIGKPEPQIFRHATDALGATPRQSLMVGDDYEADVLGALRAGLHAVWIDPDGAARPPATPPRPHGTVRSIVEFADRLDA